jgi:predicted DNA-binding protein (UPF0251 family)
MGIEDGTVKSRLSRARRALARMLTEDGTFEAKERQNKIQGEGADGG